MVVTFDLDHRHIGSVTAHERVPKSLQTDGHTRRDPGHQEIHDIVPVETKLGGLGV